VTNYITVSKALVTLAPTDSFETQRTHAGQDFQFSATTVLGRRRLVAPASDNDTSGDARR